MNVDINIKRTVPENVLELLDKLTQEFHFHISNAAYMPDCFGNVRIEAQSDNWSIRYSVDRGDHFIELGTESVWYGVDLVQCLVVGKDVTPSSSVQESVRFVAQHIPEIENLFSKKQRSQTLNQLRELQMKQLNEMFPGAIQSDDSD